MGERIRFVVCIGVHHSCVLAYKKRRGPWGALGWNGPGGTIAPGETPELAATREWTEEVSGLPTIYPGEWTTVGVMQIGACEVRFMAAPTSRPSKTLIVDGEPATFLDPYAEWEGHTSDHYRKMALRAVRACS